MNVACSHGKKLRDLEGFSFTGELAAQMCHFKLVARVCERTVSRRLIVPLRSTYRATWQFMSPHVINKGCMLADAMESLPYRAGRLCA